MATQMELVVSPGNIGGNETAGNTAADDNGNEGGGDGGTTTPPPYRNDEDVREWSRIDRITGMLERARVETGRWRANTRDAAQSYGKMIDSRERNTADGSLVQKARRQVEIFQSQGAGGRTFQVVRASHWSSSRAIDSGAVGAGGGLFGAPIIGNGGTSSTLHRQSFTNNNAKTTKMTNGSDSLSLWRSNLIRDKTTDLEHLSCLCRKLHDEALNQSANLWTLTTSSSSMINGHHNNNNNNHHHNRHRLSLFNDEKLSKKSLERRSNSSEDLSNDNDDDAVFVRDCKIRRSLQIAGNGGSDGNGTEITTIDRNIVNDKMIVAERARKYEEEARRALSASTTTAVVPKPRNLIGVKQKQQFSSIADNDFVKNDPNHPSKLAGGKYAVQNNVSQNGKTHHVVSSPLLSRAINNNNKTVVHLRNAASPDNNNIVINDNNDINDQDDQQQTIVNGNNKPTKRVEFCKTEIHFAPDSGKVNIVETDGKPPPTNKFRRRRRNNSANNPTVNGMQKNNLPLVHFGDTSYEKFIFGGQGKQSDNVKNNDNNDNETITTIKRLQRWVSPDKSLDTNQRNFDKNDETEQKNEENKIVVAATTVNDHNGVTRQARGAHTTTVNFLNSSENENGTLLSKVAEGECRDDGYVTTNGIRLQFASSSRSHSPLNFNDERDDVVVSRTTKITVHLPAPALQIYQNNNNNNNNHHYRRDSLKLTKKFSNLKSVRLVMSIGKELQALDRIFTSLCIDNNNKLNGIGCDNDVTKSNNVVLKKNDDDDVQRDKEQRQLWSLMKLDDDDDDDDGNEKRKDIELQSDGSRITIEDKPSNVYPTSTNHVAHNNNNNNNNNNDDAGRTEKKHPSDQQTTTKDTDDNQVLMKIVTTHKPTVARVESLNRQTLGTRASKSNNDETINNVDDDTAAKDDEKVYCDNVEKDAIDDEDRQPTYENVFDAVTGGNNGQDDEAHPVYENFQVVRVATKPIIAKNDAKIIDKPAIKKKASPNGQIYEKRQKRTTTCRNADNATSNGKPLKAVKSARAATPISTLSNDKKNDNDDAKRIARKTSFRSNNGSARKDEVGGAIKSTRRKIVGTKESIVGGNGVTSTGTKSVVSEKNNGSVRSKKTPVEVVYQTAVYNIQNENLVNKQKAREFKGPRLINDLICGSKTKRPSDKKAIKTAVVTQNTSKKKETPAIIKR